VKATFTAGSAVGQARLFLDISTLVRWVGPPVGIMRVEAELARYVMARRPDIGFVFYDSRVHDYRLVKRSLVPKLIGGNLFIDLTGIPDPRSVSRSRVNGALNRLDRRLLYVRRPRRAVILALERLRAKLAPSQRARVDYVQSLFFNDRYRRAFFDPDGRRRSVMGFADLFEVGPPTLKGTTILAPGAEWNTKDPDRIRALKERDGFRLVMICYDLIPILFPQFYLPRDREVFLNYFRKAIGFVDKFVCISNCTARDVVRFAAEQGSGCETSVQPLGSDLLEAGDAPLPAALKAKRYALFVSTIEPRKNHALLHRVWRRLLDAGIPQRHDFQLVFVGRPGWSTDALLQQFSDDTRGNCNFQYFPNAGDGLLKRLYGDAAFCLYPSLYEGFGLPIIEAFANGRAVIASNAGSIPEVVQDLSPSLDPGDEEAWHRTMRQWIEDPAIVASYETRIAERFVHRPWSEVAQKYLAEAETASS
jgi:glycosyltransferase involved in cell wall biosynthesis